MDCFGLPITIHPIQASCSPESTVTLFSPQKRQRDETLNPEIITALSHFWQDVSSCYSRPLFHLIKTIPEGSGHRERHGGSSQKDSLTCILDYPQSFLGTVTCCHSVFHTPGTNTDSQEDMKASSSSSTLPLAPEGPLSSTFKLSTLERDAGDIHGFQWQMERGELQKKRSHLVLRALFGCYEYCII